MTSNKIFTVFWATLMLLICWGIGVSQTKSITAQSIIEKMAAQYANASSYQDIGVVEDVKGEGGGQRETVIKFKTFFARPHFFRFEWTDRSIVTSEERLNVIWNDGKQTYSYYSWGDAGVEKKEDLSLGIAGATGISRGAAHVIPALLMEEVSGFRLTETKNVSLLGEEKFEGEDCYIVRGYHPHNFPIDMWISKRDFLLRKVKEPNDDGTYEIDIRRDIKLNGKIPAERFNYTPPPPKPRPKTCLPAIALLTLLCTMLSAKKV